MIPYDTYQVQSHEALFYTANLITISKDFSLTVSIVHRGLECFVYLRFLQRTGFNVNCFSVDKYLFSLTTIITTTFCDDKVFLKYWYRMEIHFVCLWRHVLSSLPNPLFFKGRQRTLYFLLGIVISPCPRLIHKAGNEKQLFRSINQDNNNIIYKLNQHTYKYKQTSI